MADLKLYGIPQSTYVRTARMACVEKGVSYELVAMMPGKEVDGVRHAFGKVPVMHHGDVVLAETAAICRYIDRSFGGPTLQPAEPRAAARVDQWISAVSDYLYQVMIREIVLPRLVWPRMGRPTDEAAVAAAVPKLKSQLAVLDAELTKSPWLAGPSLTLADLFLAPILHWVEFAPEGKAPLAAAPAVQRWRAAIGARPSYRDTIPPIAPP